MDIHTQILSDWKPPDLQPPRIFGNLEMRKTPLLLLSIPNSGTDWLSSTIVKSQEKCNYFREFFNPATNQKYGDILAEEFGCEYINCYKKIFSYNQEKTENIFSNTWKKETYNFTKDNFGAMRIPFYKEHFQCFGLKRLPQYSLPPNRFIEVTGWYLSIYESLLYSKKLFPDVIQVKIDHFNSQNTTMNDKMTFAFCIYQEIFLYNCKKNKIPILDYNEICNRSRNDLVFYLSSLQYHLDYDKWSEVICDTRKENEKNFKEFKSKWVVDCYGAIMI